MRQLEAFSDNLNISLHDFPPNKITQNHDLRSNLIFNQIKISKRIITKHVIKIDSYNKATAKLLEVKNKLDEKRKKIDYHKLEHDHIFIKLELECLKRGKYLIHGGFGGFPDISHHLKLSNMKDLKRRYQKSRVESIGNIKRVNNTKKKTPIDPLKVLIKAEKILRISESSVGQTSKHYHENNNEKLLNDPPIIEEIELSHKASIKNYEESSTKKTSINSKGISTEELLRSPEISAIRAEGGQIIAVKRDIQNIVNREKKANSTDLKSKANLKIIIIFIIMKTFIVINLLPFF